jgi:hypothetical protein
VFYLLWFLVSLRFSGGKILPQKPKTQSFTKNLLQIQPSAIFIIAKFKQSLNSGIIL